MTEYARLFDVLRRHGAAMPKLEGPDRMEIAAESVASEPERRIYDPLVCFVLHGQKQLLTSERELVYSTGDLLVSSRRQPVTCWTTQTPYFALTLRLDVSVLADVVSYVADVSLAEHDACVAPAEADISRAFLRIVRLLDRPEDILALWPLAERELLYRILQGPCGATLRRLLVGAGSVAQVLRVIQSIGTDLAIERPIEELAASVSMSPGSLRRHFKLATGTTPLQYQKRLRLLEARRMLLTGPLTAAAAGTAVGYRSAAHFSREYEKLFGRPPARDQALGMS